MKESAIPSTRSIKIAPSAVREHNSETVRAVTQGLGKKVLRRFWNVLKPGTSPLVMYAIDKERHYIYGGTSFSLIAEEKGEIIAYFFLEEREKITEPGLQLKAVIARQLKNGQGQPYWQPLKEADILFASDNKPRLQDIGRMNVLYRFLQQARRAGEFIDLEPRRVKSGEIKLKIVPLTDDPYEGFILVPGFQKYEKKDLPGRVIVEKNKQVVYFWESLAAKDAGAPPIHPQGDIIAEIKEAKKKEQEPTLEIIWRASSQKHQYLHKEAKTYKTQLFGNMENAVYFNVWGGGIHKRSDSNEYSGKISRKIEGHPTEIFSQEWTDSARKKDFSPYAQTIETGPVKLVEFWLDKINWEAGEPPIDKRFVMLNGGEGWEYFFSKIDVDEKFPAIMREESFFERIFRDPYYHVFYKKETEKMAGGNEKILSLLREREDYEKNLFKTEGNSIHALFLPARIDKERERVAVFDNVNGERWCRWYPLSSIHDVKKLNPYVVRREIGEIKLEEIWENDKRFIQGEAPLDVMLAAARKEKERGWTPLWLKVDDKEGILRCLADGLFTQESLTRFFSNRHLLYFYSNVAAKILGDDKFYGKVQEKRKYSSFLLGDEEEAPGAYDYWPMGIKGDEAWFWNTIGGNHFHGKIKLTPKTRQRIGEESSTLFSLARRYGKSLLVGFWPSLQDFNRKENALVLYQPMVVGEEGNLFLLDRKDLAWQGTKIYHRGELPSLEE